MKDLSLDNLPVYLSIDNREWELFTETLVTFLTTMAYLQALFAFPFNANCVEIDEVITQFIKQNWKKVNYSFPLWKVEFFQNSFDEVIALMSNSGLYIAAKTKETFNILDEKIGIDWDYNSLRDR